MKRQLALAVTVLAAAGGATAQSNEELKARLDDALKTIQDLQGRVKALEQSRAAPAAAAPAAAASGAAQAPQWGAPVVSVGTRAGDASVPDADKARLEVYGQVMLDSIYDFKRMNPDWNATLRPSQIPVVCPGSPGCGKNGDWIFSVRQSSLGLRSFIPTSWGLVKTDLSFDLFGSDGSTTLPTPTTDGSVSSNSNDSLDTGDPGCSFYAGCPPDLGPEQQTLCDVFAQDCPRGEKCTAWGAGSWTGTKCVPVTGDQ